MKWINGSKISTCANFGLLILTTTKGILSQDEAKKNGIGGKLPSYVY